MCLCFQTLCSNCFQIYFFLIQQPDYIANTWPHCLPQIWRGKPVFVTCWSILILLNSWRHTAQMECFIWFLSCKFHSLNFTFLCHLLNKILKVCLLPPACFVAQKSWVLWKMSQIKKVVTLAKGLTSGLLSKGRHGVHWWLLYP